VSSPTAKQLASWLKEADKATGLLEVSITGLVFMVAMRVRKAAQEIFGQKSDRRSQSLGLVATAKLCA
jgi:hypothetical protein